MFGFPDFLMSDSQRRMRDQWHNEEVERRCKLGVPWDPQMKWQEELNIQAKTYKVLDIFDLKASSSKADPNEIPEDSKATARSPSWLYVLKKLPRGAMLRTVYGREKGTVVFDGPVSVPVLHARQDSGDWKEDPFMSLTPMETMSLRAGTRFAKGSVIVAGLGMGHQLIEVSKRPQVKKLVLVEESKELVDFILPKVRPHLGRKLDKVVIGDAYKVMPKMSADVALVDIFWSYGGNDWERDKLVESCFGIKRIWCWGASSLRD